MKQLMILAAALVLTITAAAQPPMGQGPRGREFPTDGPMFQQMDPEQMAKEETDRLDKLVNLTPQQYKKLYKYNKKLEKQRQDEMENMMPQGRPDGMGPGGPGPGGMGPGGPRGDGQFRRGPQFEEMQQLTDEIQAKREKKYRKVLTPEQFQKWESFEIDRDAHRRML
jgi:Spy/CpxP family protein refolding chaperone